MADTARLAMTLVEGTDTLAGASPSTALMGKVNAALTKLDTSVGLVMCTSTTRPTTGLFAGMQAYETDTRRRIMNPSGTVGEWLVFANDAAEVTGFGATRAAKPVRPYGQDTAHSAFPSVVVRRDGVFVMVYRQGTDHVTSRDGIIRKSTSSDQGHTWSAPSTVMTGPAGTDLRDPCVSLSRNGTTIYLTYFKGTAVLAAAGVFFRKSTDGGATWSTEVRVESLPYAASSAPVVELDNGTLVLPYYGRSGAETFDSVWTAKSTDGGTTWPTNTRILNGQTASQHFNEPYIAMRGQQGVMNYRYGTTASIGSSVSNDNTANWGGAVAKFDGTGRPAVFWVNSTTVACIYRRLANGDAVIRSSRDAGSTWTPERLVDATLSSAGWMTYAGGDRINSGSFIVAFSQERTSTESRILFTYIGEAGSATPFGAVPTDEVAATDNHDGTVFATSFEQPDGSLAYPWTIAAGSITVVNGEAGSTAADNVPDFGRVWVGYNDMEVEAEINCGGTSVQTGAAVIFRMIDANSYMMWTVETGGINYRLYKVVGGTPTQLQIWTTGVQTLPTNAYVKYKVIARGGSIYLFVNDQYMGPAAGANTPGASYGMSGGDYTTFLNGKYAGIKLNAQATTTHKCRRFIVKV